jgi:hypothetical protein
MCAKTKGFPPVGKRVHQGGDPGKDQVHFCELLDDVTHRYAWSRISEIQFPTVLPGAKATTKKESWTPN